MNHDNTVPATLTPRQFSEPPPKTGGRSLPGIGLALCVALFILYLMLKR